MQEIIQDADYAAFRNGLMNYLNANNKIRNEDGEESRLRIIELAIVDMNYYIGEGIGNNNKYQVAQRDNIFVQRIFVITNKDIKIMKSIRESD